MSDDLSIRLVSEARKRLVASILGSAETSTWWGKLGVAEQRAYREKILVSVGTFYDYCRDIIKVTNEDVMRNEVALDLIRQIHEGQRSLEKRLRVTDG